MSMTPGQRERWVTKPKLWVIPSGCLVFTLFAVFVTGEWDLGTVVGCALMGAWAVWLRVFPPERNDL